MRTDQDVTHTTHRLDVVGASIGVSQFPAHFADVHIDAAIEGREFTAQNGIDQPITRHNISGLAQQDFQEVKFNRGQLQWLAVLINGAAGGVQFNFAHTNYIRGLTIFAEEDCGEEQHEYGLQVRGG